MKLLLTLSEDYPLDLYVKQLRNGNRSLVISKNQRFFPGEMIHQNLRANIKG
ncbi:hypothetical protein Lsan_2499, partial [Legionella santicrucis]